MNGFALVIMAERAAAAAIRTWKGIKMGKRTLDTFGHGSDDRTKYIEGSLEAERVGNTGAAGRNCCQCA